METAMKLVQLSARDFDLLADKTEMGADARHMARGVLVERQSMPAMAAHYSVTRQRVYLAVETIRREYTRSKQRGGWIGVELELPHCLAADLERFAAILRAQPDEAVRQGALVKLSRAFASVEKTLH
jgi:hypothetical protein